MIGEFFAWPGARRSVNFLSPRSRLIVRMLVPYSLATTAAAIRTGRLWLVHFEGARDRLLADATDTGRDDWPRILPIRAHRSEYLGPAPSR